MAENKLKLHDTRLRYVVEKRQKKPMQTLEMDIYDENLNRELRKQIVMDDKELQSFGEMIKKGAVIDERVT